MRFKVFAAGCILACVASALPAAGAIHPKGNFSVAGWLVSWDPASMASFEKNAALIDRVYPEWYVLGKDGLPLSIPDHDPRVIRKDFEVQKALVRRIAKEHGIQIFSMIVNYDNTISDHSGDLVRKSLVDKKLRKTHIRMLVENAVKDGADGIDIDYENLAASDAKAYAEFIRQLSVACRKKKLLLAAALAPKTNDEGTWEGNRAHDYRALAPSLDLLRPMTYDEHWATGGPGSISSPQFTEATDRYAVSAASASKVELGLAAYGYDWKGKQGVTVSYADFQALLKKTGKKAQRDPISSELVLRYDGHEVWFCDAVSYRPKYELIRKYKLAGLAMWRFGSEDPAFWEDLKTYKFAADWN